MRYPNAVKRSNELWDGSRYKVTVEVGQKPATRTLALPQAALPRCSRPPNLSISAQLELDSGKYSIKSI